MAASTWLCVAHLTDLSVHVPAQPLWTCKECYVYQIPPLKNESGHRANDWDVNKWLWSGALKVTSKGNSAFSFIAFECYVFFDEYVEVQCWA
mgnify:CR=1 FL=1